jgi:hypothetical protein
VSNIPGRASTLVFAFSPHALKTKIKPYINIKKPFQQQKNYIGPAFVGFTLFFFCV